MKKINVFLGAAVLVSSLFSVSPVMASGNLTYLTVDGKTNTTVDVGSSVDARITFETTASTDVESASWELVGSGLPQKCVDIDDHITNGTFTAPFQIDTTGATEGTWDVMIRLYGDDGPDASNLCEVTDQVDSQPFTDRITVVDTNNDNQGGNSNSSGGNSSIAVLQAQINALKDMVAALVAKLNAPPTSSNPPKPCPPVGVPTVQLQAWLMANGYAAGFNAAGVYAPTGFYGPITASAVAQASFACNSK